MPDTNDLRPVSWQSWVKAVFEQWSEPDNDYLAAHWTDVSHSWKEALRSAVEAGWIIPAKVGADRWQLSALGCRETSRSDIKVPREQAQVSLDLLLRHLARPSPLNSEVMVSQVWLFGSMLDPAKASVGDVDVFVLLGYPSHQPPTGSRREKTLAALEELGQHLSIKDGAEWASLVEQEGVIPCRCVWRQPLPHGWSQDSSPMGYDQEMEPLVAKSLREKIRARHPTPFPVEEDLPSAISRRPGSP